MGRFFEYDLNRQPVSGTVVADVDGDGDALTRSNPEDKVMEEFERKLDQIAIEYKKSLEDYDYNNELTLEVEKSRATIQELKQLLKESVARERETSEELKKKIAEVLTDKVNELQIRQENIPKEADFEQSSKQIPLDKVLEELELRKKQLITAENVNQDLISSGVKVREENLEMRVKIADLEAEMEKGQAHNSTQDLTKIKEMLQTITLAVEACPPSDKAVEFHRYFNVNTLDHFYTTDYEEVGTGNDAWTYEGVVGRVFPTPVKGTVPLLRYYNAAKGDHQYTLLWGELRGGCWGYVYEGISCYIFPGPIEGTRPLHRYYNPERADHFFTNDWEEVEGGREGWISEGIAGYVL